MNTPSNADQIYAQPHKKLSPFAFDEAVVSVFPDMISRSVPGYKMILPIIGQFADRYVTPNTHCYDLGSSLGAVSLMIFHHTKGRNAPIFAVDSSAPMIEKSTQIFQEVGATAAVTPIQADITETPINNASFVVLNFTLQFVTPEKRLPLLKNIYSGLNPNGVLILSEKIQFVESETNEWLFDLHHDFKRANGYSNLEISQKRTALENVMILDSIETHRQRLLDLGFKQVALWFQAFNFVSFIAQK